MNFKIWFLILFSFFALLSPKTIYAGRGCCSYHGGQDYCDTSTGRWVCNDGTYSPTCGCTYIAVTQAPTFKPTSVPTIKPVTPTPFATVIPVETLNPSPEVMGKSTENIVEISPTPELVVVASDKDSNSIFGLFGLAVIGVFVWMQVKNKNKQKEESDELN